MRTPGFVAEASLYPGGSYRQTVGRSIEPGHVVPAIPPCHACDNILDKCSRAELRGAICRYCAVGFCDPQDWKNPPHPFPLSEPWDVPF